MLELIGIGFFMFILFSAWSFLECALKIELPLPKPLTKQEILELYKGQQNERNVD